MGFPYQDFQDADGNYTAEFNSFYEAVAAAGCENYDCNQVARAIKDGLTPDQAAAQFTADYEQDRLGAAPEDYIDLLDRDMSMNG